MSDGLIPQHSGPVVELAVSVAPSDRPDWYAIVDAPPDLEPMLVSFPGVIPDPNPRKQRRLVHRCVARTNPLFRIVDDDIGEWYRGSAPPPADSAVAQLFAARLRNYQREFVSFALQRPGVVNADDVGTGKTLQTLTALAGSGFTPVLVVGTLLTKSVWCGPKSEPMKWLGLDVTPLETRKDAGPGIFKDAPTPWFFCHYDILEAWLPWIFNFLRPRAVAFDEAHNATPGTKRGRASAAISRHKEMRKRIALTATPVRGKRIDMWSILNLAVPDAFGASKHEFGMYFCGGVHGEYGFEYKGETHNEELKTRLSEVLMRRTKAEVMSELPPLTRQIVEVELEESAKEEYGQYKAAEKDIRKFLALLGSPLAPGISGERLVQLTKMLAILSRGKAHVTAQLASEQALSTGKVVVFCWFKDVAKTIAATVAKAGVQVYGPITGDHSIEKRIAAATAFAEDPAPCAFIATLAAASESINQLAAAQQLLMNDLYWAPKLLIQAEGRLHRGGQKSAVNVTYPLGKNTIDDDLIEVLYRKAEASDTLGLREGSKALVKSLGIKAPSDDLDLFVSQVEHQISLGGYGYEDDDLLPDSD